MSETYRVGRCKWCGQVFYVCRPCFRGQVYCCEDCAQEGYRAVQDEARSRHQSSEEGREDHRDQVRESRALQKKAVTDDTSTNLALCGTVISDFGPVASSLDALEPVIEERADVTVDYRKDSEAPSPNAYRGNTFKQPGVLQAHRYNAGAASQSCWTGGGLRRQPEASAHCAFCGVRIRLWGTKEQPRAG